MTEVSSSAPDIAVYGPDNDLRLAVEVKAKPDASDEWATHFYRNILAHSRAPQARYFLLALPRYFYLWRQRDGEAKPHLVYKADTPESLDQYISSTGVAPSSSSGFAFEMLVSTWLKGLASSSLEDIEDQPGLKWTIDTGLYEAIKDGSVLSQPLE